MLFQAAVSVGAVGSLLKVLRIHDPIRAVPVRGICRIWRKRRVGDVGTRPSTCSAPSTTRSTTGIVALRLDSGVYPGRGKTMKKIEAIIPTWRVAAVQHVLERRDIAEFTLADVWVIGAEPGDTVLHRGTTYTVDLSPRAKLEVVCGNEYALPVAYAITDAAGSGGAGDGGVLILSVEDGSSYERSAWRGVMRHSS